MSKLPFRLPKPKDPFGDLSAYWDDLHKREWKDAEPAVFQFIAHPDRSIPLLREQLLKERTPDPAKVRQLIAQLESNRHGVREGAARALADYPAVEVTRPLREALAAKPSEDARKLIEGVLGEGATFIPNLEQARRRRALHVLEWIATPDAKAVLAEVAKHAGRRIGRRSGGRSASSGQIPALTGGNGSD